MAVDPRMEELLERYPSELDDAELAALRAAAEQDPDVAAAMDALLLVDAAFDDTDLHAELSPAGQRKLDANLRAVKAWTLGPAAPTEARADNVVDFAAARSRRMAMVGLAIAAAVLVAVGFAARGWFAPRGPGGGYDPYHGGTKGDDDSAGPSLEGQIQIQGALRVQDGDSVPADQPVLFTIRLEDAASIALLEIQEGVTSVMWPAPGYQWVGVVGNNRLAPPGTDGSYTPARPGTATYVLVGKQGELRFAGPRPSTLDAFIEETGAQTLDRVTVVWSGEESTP